MGLNVQEVEDRLRILREEDDERRRRVERESAGPEFLDVAAAAAPAVGAGLGGVAGGLGGTFIAPAVGTVAGGALGASAGAALGTAAQAALSGLGRSLTAEDEDEEIRRAGQMQALIQLLQARR